MNDEFPLTLLFFFNSEKCLISCEVDKNNTFRVIKINCMMSFLSSLIKYDLKYQSCQYTSMFASEGIN